MRKSEIQRQPETCGCQRFSRMNRSRLRVLAVLLSSAYLVACSGVPVASYGKLLRLDPMSAEPADIRVAIRMDDAVDLNPARVQMRVAYVALEDGIEEAHELEVTPIRPDSISPKIEKDKAVNESVTYYGLNSEDAETLRGFQKRVREHKAGGGDGEGELTVAFSDFCAVRPLSEDNTPFTIYLKTAPEQDYFPLYGGQLGSLFDDYEQGIDAVPACDASINPQARLKAARLSGARR